MSEPRVIRGARARHDRAQPINVRAAVDQLDDDEYLAYAVGETVKYLTAILAKRWPDADWARFMGKILIGSR